MLIGIFYSQIVESSSLVSVLFREAISHPYISFFHLLVNVFSVIYIYIYIYILTNFVNCLPGRVYHHPRGGFDAVGGPVFRDLEGVAPPISSTLFLYHWSSFSIHLITSNHTVK